MPKPKKAFPTDPKVLAAYQKMIEAIPEIELKGATTPYTSHNGNMFSSVSKADRIGIRLSTEERDTFIEKYDTTLFESLPGFFQKEYVAIPESMISDTRAMRHWFRKSYDYVCSLKAKKTKRK